MTVAEYYIPSGRCIQAIDYTNLDENVTSEKIPDSLVTEYKTANGRSVFDSGGIDPDITTEELIFDELSYELVRQYMIFNFATLFYHSHENIPQPSEFSITDEIFQDFVTFTKDNEFIYESSLEIYLSEFKKVAEDDESFEKIQNDYDALVSQVELLKDDEFTINQENIKKLLRLEIVSRYYFQQGTVLSELIDDNDVQKAIEVINNQTEYLSILKLSDIQSN